MAGILTKLNLTNPKKRSEVTATYYASELTWPELGYIGVSVDHPKMLNQPPPAPWRPTDLRPIEP